MGVTTRRTGFAVLVLLAVLLPLRKPGDEATVPPGDDRAARLRELTDEHRAARVRWVALTERDSILALPARARPAGQPGIRLRGFPAGLRAEETQRGLEQLWRAIELPDSSVEVALEVYNRASYDPSLWQGMYSGNLIQSRGRGIFCVGIAPGELREDGRVWVGKELLAEVMAPCFMLAAFGRPGKGMSAWLEATRYTSARSNSWLTRPAEFLDGHGGGPWGWVFSRSRTSFEPSPRFPKLLGIDGYAIATLLAPPYHHGAPGIRCMVGDPESCVESVLHSAYTTAPDPGVPHDLTVSPSMLRPEEVTLATARAPADFFLSDIIRDQGRERFRRFWSSELPLEAAFQQAFGEPLGKWTARWAKRQWLGSWEAHYGSEAIILGANLKFSWLPVTFFWTALALAAVSWAARRKQAT